MKPPAFLLYGIGGVYNSGCEAIVRGTVEILRRVWPDRRIAYLSRRPAEDRAALSGCTVDVWDNGLPPRWHPWRAARGLLRRCKLPYTWLSFENLSWFHRDDCVIWMGGDTPDLGPGPYGSTAEVQLLELPRAILRKGCKLVVWATSLDPWPGAAQAYKDFLQRVTLVTVREPRTRRYLAECGVHNKVTSVADPAFLMCADRSDGDRFFKGKAKRTLGVNLSPLSARRIYGPKAVGKCLEGQAVFLRSLVDALGVRIILIPHVVARHTEGDDDYRYLAKMRQLLDETGSDAESVSLLPGNLGARRTKGVISRCDALVAARMHCGIAGVSSQTPTLFVSYTSKAVGMAEYVYGDLEWQVSLSDFSKPETVDTIARLLDRSDQTTEYLSDVYPKFRHDALRGGVALDEALGQDWKWADR